MFPVCILVKGTAYYLKDNQQPTSHHRVRMYESSTNRVICKYVNLDSGELYFHTNAGEQSNEQHIFTSPIRIIYHGDHAILVYPFAGQDALELAQVYFWTTYEHITLAVMDQLIERLALFHKRFLMAMGDIKPDNIVYNSFTGVVSYIDLEYATAPIPKSLVLHSTSAMSIIIPDPRTRHYRTTATAAYSSFEKGYAGEYCVFKNDEYALATTMFCLLTNRDPPMTSNRTIEQDQASWNVIHAAAFRYLVYYIHSVLHWDIQGTRNVLHFIHANWMLSGAPLLPA
jgi:serine/threonine protein kinase